MVAGSVGNLSRVRKGKGPTTPAYGCTEQLNKCEGEHSVQTGSIVLNANNLSKWPCRFICLFHLHSLQVSLRSNRGRSLVVFHPHHHLLLYSQPGSLPHCGEDGLPHRKCRGPGQADRDCVWYPGWRLNQRVLQGEGFLLFSFEKECE